jgi:hypothetical protein
MPAFVKRILLIASATPLCMSVATATPAEDRSQATSLVEHAVRLIRDDYVFPEKADAIVERLNDALSGGRYDVTDELRLAALITEDLQADTDDLHMYVRYEPQPANAPPVMAPAATPGASPGSGGSSANASRARLSNQGITELRILPGNLRYINIAQFFWERPTRQAYDRAIDFLRDGDAYIIDIRGNGGGTPVSVAYLTSHLMEADRLLMTYRLGPARTEHSRTSADLTGARLAQKPLFLLTSGHTASAAEEFASHIKHFQLGTLVGETTAGAGHRNGRDRREDGFVISISVGTAIHPVTDSGWERTGVAPDITVPRDQALEAAQLQALQRLIPTADGARLLELEWRVESLAAVLNPVSAGRPLETYAGRHEGGRRLFLRDGRLYWTLGDSNPEFEMIPLAHDLFALGNTDGVRVRFVFADDAIIAAEMRQSPALPPRRLLREDG